MGQRFIQVAAILRPEGLSGPARTIPVRFEPPGHARSTLLWVTDGSYCNRTVFRHLPERSELVARARGDITLFLPPTEEELVGKGRRRKYGAPLPKPDEIRASDAYPWQEAKIFGAGRLHDIRYKVVPRVLWRSGTRAKPLRLLIIAPLRYRRSAGSRLLYREPAYLLSSDLGTPAQTLIQAYFDRWEIE